MRALIQLVLIAVVQKSACDSWDLEKIVTGVLVTSSPVAGFPTVSDYMTEGTTVTEHSQAGSASDRVCILPPYPRHGTYIATEGLKPGDAVPHTSLTYSCEWGYRLIVEGFPLCFTGSWFMKTPICESQCKPLNSTSVEFKCYNQNSSLEISCDLPQDNNSRAKATCKDTYHSEPPPRDLNCIDGSWDYMPICTPAHQFLCLLPSYPHHGTYAITEGFKPGDAVFYTALKFSCDPSYKLIGGASSICFMGTWFTALPTCESQCKPLNSTSVEFKCYKQNSSLEISCDLPQDNNSRAKATCKDSYHSEPPPRDLNCIDGKWDYMPICTLVLKPTKSKEDPDNAPSCGRIKSLAELKIKKRNSSIKTYSKYLEFPWMVALFAPKTETQPCIQSDSNCWNFIGGGSLIGPTVVLSTETCVYRYKQYKQYKLKVRAGASNLNTFEGQLAYHERFVNKIIAHPQYNDSSENGADLLRYDAALLVMESAFASADNLAFICLPPPNLNIAPTNCKVADFNVDTYYTENLTNFTYVDLDQCQRTIRKTRGMSSLVLHDSFMCAASELDQGTCQGDDGSSLMCIADNHYYARGLVSVAIPCNRNQLQSYTDVAKVRNWIDQAMKANGFTTDTYTFVGSELL